LTKRIKAPLPGAQTLFDVTTNTTGKDGLNDVKVYVNPRILPEVYYDNNVLTLTDFLNVIPDHFNPVLDVTVDGRYLVNGDLVSANPSIVLKLWDENALKLVTDTTGVNIFIKYPCDLDDCPFTAIYFNRPDVEWFPATTTSDFTTIFTPQNLAEGVYMLRIEAKDTRNNGSGMVPYEVTFEVSSQNDLVLQPPYPNPSSSIFFFDLVISGDEHPDGLRLEIINSSGQLVGTFEKYTFFTGTNSIAWDASNFPNGLYFYRVSLTSGSQVTRKLQGKLALVK
jgi:hypothetical protein